MVKTFLASLLTIVLLISGSTANAQKAGKVHRIGYLASTRSAFTSAAEDALRRDLRALGYIEGQNIVIESRSAEGKLDRLPGLVAELVRLNVDVIVVTSVQGAAAAKKATETIPIVFAIAQDPVGIGLVTSLAQPGGNLTGVTDFARELAGKRLELLKETVPKVTRVAVLSWNPAGPDYAAERNEIELVARALRVQIQSVEVRGADDLEGVFTAMTRGGANAFMGLTDTRLSDNRKRLIELGVKNRLPAAYQDRVFVEAGGLMSYGTNRVQWRGRVAHYVDKILKGTKPADIPVEQPMKFEFIINLKAAKQIGVTIPPNVLARADKVIR
jgi:putative ABC transport system substrate-binding protein